MEFSKIMSFFAQLLCSIELQYCGHARIRGLLHIPLRSSSQLLSKSEDLGKGREGQRGRRFIDFIKSNSHDHDSPALESIQDLNFSLGIQKKETFTILKHCWDAVSCLNFLMPSSFYRFKQEPFAGFLTTIFFQLFCVPWLILLRYN